MKFSSKDAPHVDEDEGRYRVYSIIPYDPERGWELYKIEMEPGAKSRSEAHTEGVEEKEIRKPAAIFHIVETVGFDSPFSIWASCALLTLVSFATSSRLIRRCCLIFFN